jgi:glycosyltransferase involved in cell wall biosynthesis
MTMPTERPKFSILLPTRNRPQFVRHAAASVLNQTVRDFELVVSDNNDDDRTADVVASFRDERIVCVRPATTLGMPDNWQNALNHSRGEWVILLEDDCVLSSRCLEILNETLARHSTELVSWDWWAYFSDDHPDVHRRQQYVARPYTAQSMRLNAADELREIFAFRFRQAHPRPYNACVARSTIRRIEAKLGAAYLPPAPDYTFLAAAVAEVASYIFLDLPLMLSNSGVSTPHSSEASFSTFANELAVDGREGYTPIRLPRVKPWNIIAESICRVQKALPALASYPLELVPYLIDFMAQLLEFKDAGFAVELERAKFVEFLSQLPWRDRAKVWGGVARRRARWVANRRLKGALFRLPPLVHIASKLGSRKIIRGAEAGFSDIGAAVRCIDATLPQRTSELVG